MNGSKPRFLKTNSCTHTRCTKTQTNMLFSFKQWGGYDLCKGERRHRGRRGRRLILPCGRDCGKAVA